MQSGRKQNLLQLLLLIDSERRPHAGNGAEQAFSERQQTINVELVHDHIRQFALRERELLSKPIALAIVRSLSLYAHEAREADRLTEVLERAGWRKANRSLVVREALRRLEEDLVGKDDEGVFRYFVDRHARRVGASQRAAPETTRADQDAATAVPVRRDLLDLAERKP